MKRIIYWIGATVLIVTLLITLFIGGSFIAKRHWPFPLIWGAFVAILGILLIIIGRTFPGILWGIEHSATAAEPHVFQRAAWTATVFGSIIVGGGVGFALTGQVEVLIGAFGAGVIFMRLAAGRRGSDDASGPATYRAPEAGSAVVLRTSSIGGRTSVTTQPRRIPSCGLSS